jgi:hypothetical protein
MEINEGNKLIAEFMGGKWYVDTPTILEKHIVSPSGYAVKCVDKLKYHTSWDWLMPVVEKIESGTIGCQGYVHIGGFEISAYCSGYLERNLDVFSFKVNGKRFSDKEKRSAVWQAVVQFIQWYNSGNKVK